jgi:hypothetical protein
VYSVIRHRVHRSHLKNGFAEERCDLGDFAQTATGMDGVGAGVGGFLWKVVAAMTLPAIQDGVLRVKQGSKCAQ